MTANEVFEVIDLKRKNQSLRSQLEKAEKVLKDILEVWDAPDDQRYFLFYKLIGLASKYFEEKKESKK